MKKSILTTAFALAVLFAGAQIKVFPGGKVYVGAIDTTGAIRAIGDATLKINGGGTSGLTSYSLQSIAWGQNIQSYVCNANTVSYVVNWNKADRFFVAGRGWLYANGAYFGSDRILKTNITPLESSSSLAKVLNLNGYSYNAIQEPLSADCGGGGDDTTGIDDKTEIGLMADEVELVIPEVVRTISEDNKKGIAYQNIVVLLIESTKEQQKQINQLQEQTAQLFDSTKAQQTQINQLQAQVAKLMAFSNTWQGSGGGDVCKLSQNNSNPFNVSTNISYYLTANVTKANIKIWDMQTSIEIKNISLNNSKGNASVTLQANELPATGKYIYALIVDGQIIDSKILWRTQ